jgi:hypothetical protein
MFSLSLRAVEASLCVDLVSGRAERGAAAAFGRAALLRGRRRGSAAQPQRVRVLPWSFIPPKRLLTWPGGLLVFAPL